VADGACVLVEGEAGIGKTRLLEALRARLRRETFAPEIWVGRCLEGARLPMAPLAQCLVIASGQSEADGISRFLVDDLSSGMAPAEAENAAHLVALSAGHSVPQSRVRQIEPARLPAEIQRAWVRWMTVRAARRPLVLFLEDAHWADGGTRALLEDLASAARPGLGVVATSRPGAPPLAGFRLLKLADLPSSAAGPLAAGVLGRPIHPDLARFLYERSGGHPYFLEEIARWLERDGLLAGDPARLARAPERLPESLHGLLVARLDSLPSSAKEALKVASAFGRVFWTGALEETAGRQVEKDLDLAESRGLVVAHAASTLPGDRERAFRHALLREAAYSLLPKRDRLAMHARAAEVLRSRAGGRSVRALTAGQLELAGAADAAAAEWLAVHDGAAEDSAISEALSAAREARRLGAGEPALLGISHAARTLGLFDEAEAAVGALLASPSTTPVGRGLALLVSSSIATRRNDFPGSLAPLEEALILPLDRATSDLVKATRAETLARLSRFEEAEAEAKSLLPGFRERAAAGDHTVMKGLGAALSTVALVAFRSARFDEAIERLREGIGYLEQTEHRVRLAGMTMNLGQVLQEAGDQRAAREVLTRAVDEFEAVGDAWAAASARAVLAVTALDFGDVAVARELLERSVRECRENSNPVGQAVATATLAGLCLSVGEYVRSIDLYRESEEIRVRARDAEGILSSHLGIAFVRIYLGEWDEAERALGELGAQYREAGRRVEQLHVTGALLTLRFLQGRVDEMASIADEALADPALNRASRLRLDLLVARCRAAVARGEPDAVLRARQILETAERLGSQHFQSGGRILLARALARDGKSAEARDLLSKERVGRDQEGVSWEYWPAVDLVEALLELGDRAAAVDRLEAALELARKRRAHGQIRRLEAIRPLLDR
jgi:tetratricopeptide (TPR) repeat protein